MNIEINKPEIRSGAQNRTRAVYGSVDSTPAGFSQSVAQWRAWGVIILFTGLAWIQLSFVNTPELSWLFSQKDYTYGVWRGETAISSRVFIVSFMFAFSAFAGGSFYARLKLGLDMVFTYALFSGIMDVASAMTAWSFGLVHHAILGSIISGIMGFGIFAIKLMERGLMPVRIPVIHGKGGVGSEGLRLFLAILLASIAAWYGTNGSAWLIDAMRSFSLLGGVGPGIFAFLPVLFLSLYLMGRFIVWQAKAEESTEPVTIVIPAHNEDYVIERTITAIDRAAVAYKGKVTVLVMDNRSEDNTAQLASETLAKSKNIEGSVIFVARAGKANALNAGLDAVKTKLYIRIDADTQVAEETLKRAISRMNDDRVGVVGGIPIPPGGGIFDRARMLEVLVKHGFYGPALTAVNGVVGVPGMFAVYRTDLLKKLGGFVAGMNGEDTDISLRVGELGYRVVVDPSAFYISEVPTTWGHMREQRLRWFRSVYHVSSRCRDIIYSGKSSLRGKIILPYMLVNAGRRAMMIPLIIFAALEIVGNFNPQNAPAWASVIAVGIGAPTIIAVAAALMNGRAWALVGIPEYILFRIVRSWLTMESALTITLRDSAIDLAVATEQDIQADKDIRTA